MARIVGTAGNDALVGDRSYPDEEDILEGLEGNDRLYGLGGSDTLTDTDGNNALYGGSGNDRLLGGSGNDRLDGGEGNDAIDDYGGVNTILAGAGDDIVTLVGLSGQSGSADGGIGSDILRAEGDISKVRLSGFEHLGSSNGNLRITAGQLNAFTSVDHNAITLATAGKVGANFLPNISFGALSITGCQTASERDPGSASNRDPFPSVARRP